MSASCYDNIKMKIFLLLLNFILNLSNDSIYYIYGKKHINEMKRKYAIHFYLNKISFSNINVNQKEIMNVFNSKNSETLRMDINKHVKKVKENNNVIVIDMIKIDVQ